MATQFSTSARTLQALVAIAHAMTLYTPNKCAPTFQH